MNQWKNIRIIGVTTCLFSSLGVYSAGFEKTVMWGGRWSGLAGAAVSAVEGGDSLFYNPAGLVQGGSHEVSLNYSPLLTRTTGAQTRDDEELTSDKKIKNVFGATSKYQVNNDFALGAGLYVSGGAGASFEGVDFSAVNANYRDLKPNVESSVSVLELGVGGAYRLSKNWSVGAAWRGSLGLAKFSSAEVLNNGTTNPLVNTRFDKMKGDNLKGVRIGTQYLSSDSSWGLGASYRSSIDLKLKGSAEGQAELGANGADLTMTGGDQVYLATVFPQQVNVGGFYQVAPKHKVFAEYSWTDYSKNEEIKISGDALNLGATNVLAGKSIILNWQDAHAIKLGHEMMLDQWQLRYGYALTGRVTDKDNVSITFSAPGVGHSFTLGAGTKFLNEQLHFDVAGEYSVAKGEGTRGTTGISGDYSSSAFGLHSGLRYFF